MNTPLSVAFVRGQFLNMYEGQNYAMLSEIRLTGYASLTGGQQHHFPFPIRRFPSLSDIAHMPILSLLPGIGVGIRGLSNRVLGDQQILYGLEHIAGAHTLFHTADPHYYYSYQLAKMRAAKYISVLLVTSWETIAHNNETIYAKRMIKEYTKQHADHFLCYTQRAADALREEGTHGNRISVLPLGVDLQRFVPRKNPDIAPFTISCIARLVPEKGISDCMRMFSILLQSHRNIYIQFVGDGPMRHIISRWISDNALSHYVKIVSATYEHMPTIYTSSDMVLLLSKTTKTWEEQYGMVLIEAMASGVPIVTYATGSIPEVVGDVAMQSAEGDIASVIANISRLISDRSLRQKLGTMGRARAESRYNAIHTAYAIRQLYEHLSNRSHP